MNFDTAASDLVAAMALIAVFVTAAAIVSVTLFSSPIGDTAPAMIARNETAEGGDLLYIYHEGGDPLEREHFEILIDGVSQTRNFTLSDASGEEQTDWTSWKTGEALVLNKNKLTSKNLDNLHIQIVGEGMGRAGSDWLLHEIGGETPEPTPTTPEPTPTTPEPTPTTPEPTPTTPEPTPTTPEPTPTTPEPTPTTPEPTPTTPEPTPTTPEPTPTTPEPMAANFTANVTSGNAPLAVQFNDTSAGNPNKWLWDFGDGGNSTAQNPEYTYVTAGNYTVSLTASNAYGNDICTKLDYIQVTEKPFIDFVIDENVFVYGTVILFSGGNVNGPGATVIITGDLDTADTNLGASINVSYIYIDGNVNLDTGSAGLGSVTDPGAIYVNGSLTLWNGKRHIYGDVYVNGDFSLKDAWIHGNVYVDGNLTLGWTPTLEEDTRIYYTGNLTKPNNYNADILAKCNHTTTVPGFTMPDQGIPSTKPPEWYTDKGYTSSGPLTSNMKIFAGSYSSTSERSNATNVVIIAHTGDITITGMGSNGVTGVFFAPKGKVTFNGGFLEGVVIARDGFFVTSGGTTVTFKNIEEYITDPADYPF